jgi:hypothetical protein
VCRFGMYELLLPGRRRITKKIEVIRREWNYRPEVPCNRIYNSQTHPANRIPIAKGNAFPPCSHGGQGHGNNA